VTQRWVPIQEQEARSSAAELLAGALGSTNANTSERCALRLCFGDLAYLATIKRRVISHMCTCMCVYASSLRDIHRSQDCGRCIGAGSEVDSSHALSSTAPSAQLEPHRNGVESCDRAHPAARTHAHDAIPPSDSASASPSTPTIHDNYDRR